MIPGLYVRDNDAYRNSGQRDGRCLSAGGMMLLCAFGSLVSSIAVFFCLAHRGEFLKASEKRNVLQGRRALPRGDKRFFDREPYNPFDKRRCSGADAGRFVASGRCQGAAHGRLGDNEDRRQGVAVVAGNGHRGRAACCDTRALPSCASFPRFKRIQWLQDSLNQSARENLTGIRVVHAYNAEKYQERSLKRSTPSS